MLDFRVVIAACIAGVVILLGGIGLVASFKIAHEPAAVRPANRIVERPRIEPNASRPFVIETPAVKPAPVAVAAPAPAAPPAAIEITGTIAPKPAPAIPAPAFPAALAPAATEPVENPAAVADLPVNTKSAKKGPRRPRPAAPAPGPTNPFSAIFGGFTNQ